MHALIWIGACSPCLLNNANWLYQKYICRVKKHLATGFWHKKLNLYFSSHTWKADLYVIVFCTYKFKPHKLFMAKAESSFSILILFLLQVLFFHKGNLLIFLVSELHSCSELSATFFHCVIFWAWKFSLNCLKEKENLNFHL